MGFKSLFFIFNKEDPIARMPAQFKTDKTPSYGGT